MATLTQMTLDGDIAQDAVIRHDAGTGTPFYTHCNDAPSGASSDYVENDNSETTGVATFDMTGVDADFGSMLTLNIDVDVWAETAVSNDTITLVCQIFENNGQFDTPLTAATGNLGTDADTTRTQRNATFSSLAGNKTQWDAAIIRFTWTYSQSAGPDNANLRLYGCDIDGTYTAAAANDTVAGFIHNNGPVQMFRAGRS